MYQDLVWSALQGFNVVCIHPLSYMCVSLLPFLTSSLYVRVCACVVCICVCVCVYVCGACVCVCAHARTEALVAEAGGFLPLPLYVLSSPLCSASPAQPPPLHVLSSPLLSVLLLPLSLPLSTFSPLLSFLFCFSRSASPSPCSDLLSRKWPYRFLIYVVINIFFISSFFTLFITSTLQFLVFLFLSLSLSPLCLCQ